MDVRELAGNDAQATLRRKSWDALGKWIASRVGRQRGVYVPNLFQIYWKAVAQDGTGSRLNRPVFVLSDRFAENFGVRQAGAVERNPPAPGTGDEVNFYHLAIQHSEGLSKDQAFGCIRDMLFRLGDAAKSSRELRLDCGAGTLVVAEREVSFEFGGGLGGSTAGEGEREKVSHLDPMLAGRQASGGAKLALAGHAAGPTAADELISRLSAEEEERLFADVDALDPESVLEREAAPMRAGELEAPTRTQLGRAMGVDPTAFAERSVEEVGAELEARAAALEAQLSKQRAESDRLEAKLRATGGPGRSAKPARVPPLSHAPELPAGGLDLLGSGGLSVSGSGGGGSNMSGRRGASIQRVHAGGRPAGGGGGGGAPPPPMLSVGFASSLAPPALGGGRPVVNSIVNQAGGAHGGAMLVKKGGELKVPTAPPLPPFRWSAPQPNDAANQAWKRHSAPHAKATGKPTAAYGRAVGGPAPPFLAAPPVVAAALVAKSQGF